MQTRITARHVQVDDGLRANLEKSVTRLSRYYDGIVDARVVLHESERPHEGKSAEVVLNVYRQTLTAQGHASTHTEAVNNCVRQLRRQVLRYKDRLRGTKHDPRP
jgi:putative sigma-54 modulation protein